MNRSRACLMSVVISLCAVAHAVTIASAGPSEAPTNASAMTLADAEHARLVAMRGAWDVEMTFWFKPGGQGLTTKATSTYSFAVRRALRRREDRGRAQRHAVHDAVVDWVQRRHASVPGDADREHEFQSHRRERRDDEQMKQFEFKADYPLAGETWHNGPSFSRCPTR